jgi:hypothetical protein
MERRLCEKAVGLSSASSPLSANYGKVCDAVVEFSTTKISLRRPVTSYSRVQKLIGAIICIESFYVETR